MKIDTSVLDKYARYKPLLVPFAAIAIVFVLTLTLEKFMFENLNRARINIDTLKTNNESLTNKEELLTTLSQTDLSGQAFNALNAVPADSPSLFALSSIREMATNRGLSISDARVSTGTGENQVDVSITLEGGIIPTLLFISDTKIATPLMRVSKLEFGGKGEVIPKTRLTVVVAWAPIPFSIGRPEDPLEGFLPAELEVLTKISHLRRPASGQFTPFTPQTGTGRQNPFEF